MLRIINCKLIILLITLWVTQSKLQKNPSVDGFKSTRNSKGIDFGFNDDDDDESGNAKNFPIKQSRAREYDALPSRPNGSRLRSTMNSQNNPQPHIFQPRHNQNMPTSGPYPLNPLLRKVSSASLSLVYFSLAWRAMANYELASQFSNHLLRILCTSSVGIIFILNALGFFLNLIRPIPFKNHLKFILAMNTIREFIEFLYNVYKIITVSSASIPTDFPKDFYMGRLLASIYFMTVCFSTSRIRWVPQQALHSSAQYHTHKSHNYPPQNTGYTNPSPRSNENRYQQYPDDQEEEEDI